MTKLFANASCSQASSKDLLWSRKILLELPPTGSANVVFMGIRKDLIMDATILSNDMPTRFLLPVTGMTCSGCAARVQNRLSAETGVVSANVNLALDVAEVEAEAGAQSLPSLASAVRDLGFGIAEERIELAIIGMTCSSCAGRIERAVSGVPGVLGVSVNLALETAEVRVARGSLDPRALISAIEAAGYRARQLDDEVSIDPSSEAEAIDRRERTELIIAAALTLPLVVQMIVMVAGIEWHMPVWLEVALATPVQFWIGRRFYRAAWRALKARSGNMDQLVVLGTSAAYFYSLWMVISQGGLAGVHLYFEAAAVIVTLVLAGKYLESRAKRSASSALRELMALQPQRARILRGGEEIELATSEVALGDVVVVKPGERIPVDGLVIKGESEIDESLITGESLPVLRKPDDAVVAGAINGTGLLRLRAERIGKDTTLAAIARLVSQAQAGKAPIQRLVDRISGVFVPVVLVFAALTFAGWLLTGHALEPSLIAAISVLVIACPCALGLATPTALVAGTGAAARQGILIKDIETLERAHHIDTVVFDKTGTLTLGKPAVTETMAVDGDDNALLALAASAQSGSEHPLANGIVHAAKAKGLELGSLERFEAHVGQGVEAVVGGATIRIGRPDFALDEVAMDWRKRALSLEAEGKTVVWIAAGGKLRGLIAMADTLRPDAAEAVRSLKVRGIEVVLLTGDNRATAERIAADVGIAKVEAETRPETKAAFIISLVEQGRRVAMVGDGVNDAPALAAATVGVAMGGGAAVAAEAAGITLMRPKPALLSGAMTIAAKTSGKIRQNLFWAFIYNVIGLPIAALGLLNPAIAGAAMALSSVSVVTNSLLLKRWRPDLEETA